MFDHNPDTIPAEQHAAPTTHPPTQSITQRDNQRHSGTAISYLMLARVALLALIGMFLYETAKETLFPGFTKWQSHIVTIVVSSSLATLGTYLALKALGRAEAARRMQEQRYQLLAENATDLISTQTSDGTFLYVSPSCQTLLGYSPGEMVGRGTSEFVHADDLADVKHFRSHLVTDSTHRAVAHRIRCKDGQYMWFESSGKYLGETDQEAAFVIVSRDITERKQAEVDLQNYVRYLSTLHSIDRVILNAESVTSITNESLRRIRQIVRYEQSTLAVYDFDAGHVEIQTVSATQKTPNSSKIRLPLSAFPSPDQLPSEGLHRVDNVTLGKATERYLVGTGMDSFINAPLIVEDTVIGVIVVSFATDCDEASDDTTWKLIRQLADHLAVAIKQERLSKQLAQHTRNLEMQMVEHTVALAEANEQLKELDLLRSQMAVDTSSDSEA